MPVPVAHDGASRKLQGCSDLRMPELSRDDLNAAAAALAAAGCIAAEEEARELALAAAQGAVSLTDLVQRRTTGEPLAWITGQVRFCGCAVAVERGVFVPRWQSEPLAERAAALLPERGRALDLGSGSGALACALRARRPRAQVIGTESDPIAVRCARHNGVRTVQGDLFSGVPESWRGRVDVIVGVLPYVPTVELDFLPRDVLAFEPIGALDGGVEGLDLVRRAVLESTIWLAHGGHLLLEVGGDQADRLRPSLDQSGFRAIRIGTDADGDVRSVEATFGTGRPVARGRGAHGQRRDG